MAFSYGQSLILIDNDKCQAEVVVKKQEEEQLTVWAVWSFAFVL